MMIPELLLGTFGNTVQLDQILYNSLLAGVRGFDTAPSYGNDVQAIEAIVRNSEKLSVARDQIFLETKIDDWQMAKYQGDVSCFIKDYLRLTKLGYLDAVLIHWPFKEYLFDTWDSLCGLKKDGLVKEIGICNLKLRHLNNLKKESVVPPILQIERHPLLICKEELDFCKSNGIEVLSYSPLCQMNKRIVEDVRILEISQKYNKTVAQIVLKWHIQTGSHPIFKSSSPDRIKSNIDIFDFSLLADELKYISSLDCDYKIFLESWGCPGF